MQTLTFYPIAFRILLQCGIFQIPSDSMSRMYDVNLDVDSLELLFKGSRGVNREMLAIHSQAAVFCLQKQGHNSPKEGRIEGDWNESMSISWKLKKQEDLLYVWEDERATEDGAIMIALSLVAHKNYRVSRIAQRRLPGSRLPGRKKSSFDYWLENNPTTRATLRME